MPKPWYEEELPLDMIPGDVLIGKTHVNFLEFMQILGRTSFAENDDFGEYTLARDELGEECRMTRQLALRVIHDEAFQENLLQLREYLEWLIPPQKN